MLVSDQGLEPWRNWFWISYVYQLHQSDKWSPERASNPQSPLFKSSSYTNSDTGRFGGPGGIWTLISRIKGPVCYRYTTDPFRGDLKEVPFPLAAPETHTKVPFCCVFLAPPEGLEPSTSRLTAACSAGWATGVYKGLSCQAAWTIKKDRPVNSSDDPDIKNSFVCA